MGSSAWRWGDGWGEIWSCLGRGGPAPTYDGRAEVSFRSLNERTGTRVVGTVGMGCGSRGRSASFSGTGSDTLDGYLCM